MPVETYSAFNPPISIERMEQTRCGLAPRTIHPASHGLFAGKPHPEYGSHKKSGEVLIPGSTTDDKLHYGPLAQPPSVDCRANVTDRAKHPEFGAKPITEKGEKLYPGEKDRTSTHYSPFELPPQVEFKVDHKKDAALRKPQYGASKTASSGLRFGPCNLPPTVDVASTHHHSEVTSTTDTEASVKVEGDTLEF